MKPCGCHPLYARQTVFLGVVVFAALYFGCVGTERAVAQTKLPLTNSTIQVPPLEQSKSVAGRTAPARQGPAEGTNRGSISVPKGSAIKPSSTLLGPIPEMPHPMQSESSGVATSNTRPSARTSPAALTIFSAGGLGPISQMPSPKPEPDTAATTTAATPVADRSNLNKTIAPSAANASSSTVADRGATSTATLAADGQSASVATSPRDSALKPGLPAILANPELPKANLEGRGTITSTVPSPVNSAPAALPASSAPARPETPDTTPRSPANAETTASIAPNTVPATNSTGPSGGPLAQTPDLKAGDGKALETLQIASSYDVAHSANDLGVSHPTTSSNSPPDIQAGLQTTLRGALPTEGAVVSSPGIAASDSDVNDSHHLLSASSPAPTGAAPLSSMASAPATTSDGPTTAPQSLTPPVTTTSSIEVPTRPETSSLAASTDAAATGGQQLPPSGFTGSPNVPTPLIVFCLPIIALFLLGYVGLRCS